MTLIYTWNFLAYYLRIQFWILYYRVFKKAERRLTNSKSLHVANIKEIQSLYCSGLDLEKPLMLSLSPCSKQEVDGCINDFATTFSSNYSHSSLCRYSIRPFFLTLISCICEEHEKMRNRAGPVPHNFWSQKIICFCLNLFIFCFGIVPMAARSQTILHLDGYFYLCFFPCQKRKTS